MSPTGTQHKWTREELVRALAVSGAAEHQALADEVGLSVQTIYSVRQRIRLAGGVDSFLEAQHVAGEPLLPRRQETIDEQLERLYVINVSRAGRGSQPQYTVTIPSQLAAVFVEKYGRQIRFVPTEDGIKIEPVPKQAPVALPSWAEVLAKGDE